MAKFIPIFGCYLGFLFWPSVLHQSFMSPPRLVWQETGWTSNTNTYIKFLIHLLTLAYFLHNGSISSSSKIVLRAHFMEEVQITVLSRTRHWTILKKSRNPGGKPSEIFSVVGIIFLIYIITGHHYFFDLTYKAGWRSWFSIKFVKKALDYFEKKRRKLGEKPTFNTCQYQNYINILSSWHHIFYPYNYWSSLFFRSNLWAGSSSRFSNKFVKHSVF